MTVFDCVCVCVGSWVMYDAKSYKGDLYVLSEGDYPNFSSMGCPSSYVIRSLKPVPQVRTLTGTPGLFSNTLVPFCFLGILTGTFHCFTLCDPY